MRASPLLRRMTASVEGFAGIRGLVQPRDWLVLAQDAVTQCQGLVGDVVQAPPTVAVVRLLDEMSDTLCQVLDAAEFCRNVHVDAEWRAAAERVCVELGGYVQELNTHYGIYTALVAALDRQAVAAPAAARAAAAPDSGGGGGGEAGGFGAEALLVGRMLRRDFERYGVHLSGAQRDRMSGLMARAQGLGMRLTQNVADPGRLGSLELTGPLAEAAQALPDGLRRRLRPLQGGAFGGVRGLACPADTAALQAVQRAAGDEGLRRAAWEACHRSPADNLAVLDALVEARHEVARLMGFPSYAAYQLDSFSLAATPAAVDAFLRRFAGAIAPRCQRELQELRSLKAQLGGGDGGSLGSGADVQPWDRQWLMAAARAGSSDAAALDALPSYLELERVVGGLSRLLAASMGVSLRERPLAPGEGWAPGVRKLEAVHDTDGYLGTVYLDLYRRPHKFPSAAHFTLRCGRRLGDGSYQTPVVALVAGFAEHAALSMHEVETLFHECGHALNSLLSRTEYQHLSGTRGAVDMVEVPSHTLEHFAADPRVLALFARHRRTGEALPAALLAALERSRRRFVGLDQQLQLQYCLIDQLLHGPDPPTGAAAEAAVADIMRQHSALGHAAGCHPHIRFTHLVGYGATYYSYLFAQCLSARIWQDHLAGNPTSRQAGELLRHRLLEPGGAKEPHSMVQDLLSGSAASSGGSGGSGTSRAGSGSGGLGAAAAAGLHASGGGFFPDLGAMLEQQGLLAA